jgi:hypothetical protein
MVIKATVNKTGRVTDNTSRTDIIVGKYSIFNLKANNKFTIN